MMLRATTLILSVCSTPAFAMPDLPNFVNDAGVSGIEHIYDGPWEYYVGGGASAFDCNGDLHPDLFLSGGENASTLYVNESKTVGPLRFKAVEAGIDAEDWHNVLGAYPLDIDNDGLVDLVTLRLGENILFKGLGDCQFRNANDEWSFDGGNAWTTAFSATWEKGSTFPTLAFGNYVDRDAPNAPWGTCAPNSIVRADTASETLQYTDRHELRPGYCSLGMLFTDWSREGVPSLRITNDRHYYRGGEEQLVDLNPGEPPRLNRRGDGWQKLQIWGMGIAAHDIDGDGYLEYGLSSMGDTKIQRLVRPRDREPVYEDVAFALNATAHRPYDGDDHRPSTGWHIEFQDFNNDSLADLFIAKGNVEAMPDFADYDPDNLLIGLHGGKFHEAGLEAGIAKPTKGRGAAIADFNLDGLLDIVVVNRGAPASIFRNKGHLQENGKNGPMGNWAAIRLRQDVSNLNAVGAEIRVRVGTKDLSRDVTVGGGHAGGTSGWTHFGLGVADRALVRVRWPDGKWGPWQRLFANSFIEIDRDLKRPRTWLPDPVQ